MGVGDVKCWRWTSLKSISCRHILIWAERVLCQCVYRQDVVCKLPFKHWQAVGHCSRVWRWCIMYGRHTWIAKDTCCTGQLTPAVRGSCQWRPVQPIALASVFIRSYARELR